MKLVVVEIRDHCQGGDIVTHGLRVEGWNPYGPGRAEAQRVADRLNELLRSEASKGRA